MLKFSLKQQRKPKDINFIGEWCTPTAMMQEDKYTDTDVLAKWFGATEGTPEYESKMDEILEDVGF